MHFLPPILLKNPSKKFSNYFICFKKCLFRHFSLKSRKITPVLINQTDVFLLVEVKRPPIILETQIKYDDA